MRAGRLRKKIFIQNTTSTRDAYGADIHDMGRLRTEQMGEGRTAERDGGDFREGIPE